MGLKGKMIELALLVATATTSACASHYLPCDNVFLNAHYNVQGECFPKAETYKDGLVKKDIKAWVAIGTIEGYEKRHAWVEYIDPKDGKLRLADPMSGEGGFERKLYDWYHTQIRLE